jgi:hypothetical protein
VLKDIYCMHLPLSNHEHTYIDSITLNTHILGTGESAEGRERVGAEHVVWDM